MMHARLEPLVPLAATLAELWTKVYLALEKGGIALDTPVARLAGSTLSEFDKRLRATLDFVPALAKLDDASQLMFLPRVDSVSKQLRVATQHLTQLHSELAPQADVSYKDVSSNMETLQRLVNGSATHNISSGGMWDQVHAASVALFDLLAGGVRFGRGQSFSLYLAHGQQLRELLGQAGPLVSEIRQLQGRATQAAEAAAEHQAAVSKLADDAQKAFSEASKDRGQVAAALDEATAKLAAIRETAQGAASLQSQVSTYSAEFDALQKSLSTMLEQHNGFVKEMGQSREKSQAREAEIDRLTAKAESMIKGATTAGLGESLENTRQLYEQRMSAARLGFLFSVVILLICSIPLLAQLFPGLFASWGLPVPNNAPPGNATEATVALIGKLVLLFPATWLTSFFSKSYAECFHLEREYAHKAALARSVEGFKKEAPEYEQLITAAVFYEVQSNPSKQAAPEPAEHPIMGPLMKKLADAFPTGKAATPPAAGK